MILIENIKKRYKKNILNGVNLKVDKGKCVGILGSNGCGKTTLLGIMSGTLKYDSGKIFYDGQLMENKKMFLKYVGYVPQENPLIEEVSARDNIRLWYGFKYDESIIKSLGIDKFIDKKIYELSGGMKRRVSIAVALMGNPQILILDEPGAALDIYGKKEVISCIKRFADLGKTIIISTHDRDEIDICDELYVMEEGTLKKNNF